MKTAWPEPLPSHTNDRHRAFLLLTLFFALAWGSVRATTWYTISDGPYNNTAGVWSLNGTDPCGCAPGSNIPGPFDSVVVRHKIDLTNNVRLSGRSEFFIDQGASLLGPYDFLIANASLTNRGNLSIDDVDMRLSSHFFAINNSNLSGTLSCDRARVELSGSLNIGGNVENKNGGFIQIFGNSTMYVDGVYHNDGVTEIAPGTCINLVAHFINPITGNVLGGGYIHSFSNISNTGFWEPTVDWCADGTGTGLPTPPNCLSCGPLPVVLATFEAAFRPDQGAVELKWTTLQELNNDFFTLERSEDGQHYHFLDQVPAESNPGTGARYLSLDPEPFNGQAFYRLRQTDRDGSEKVLGVVRVNSTDSRGKNAELFPNPFSERLGFSIGGGEASTLEVVVTDLSGRVLLRQAYQDELSYHHGELDLGGLPAGTYLVRLRAGHFNEVRKVLKR